MRISPLARVTGLLAATIALGASACGETSDNARDGGTGQPASDTPSATGTTAPGGTGTATGTTGPTPPVDPGSSAGSDRCHTADLSVDLRPQGAAAGNIYALLVFTNTSDHTCAVYGYGGVQLLDDHRKEIVTTLERNAQHTPSLVTLRSGGIASSLLHWGDVPAGDEPTDGPCEPRATYLLVTPPDETDPLTIDWPGGPVCQRGRFDQWAYAPGLVSPG